MSENNEPTAQMPVATMLEVVKGLEEDMQELHSRNAGRTDTVTRLSDHRPGDRKTEETSRAAIEGCIRTGEVMKALFPNGLQLQTEEEFATFRLFDRLVGDVVHFADRGMTRAASLRDISLHAMLLETVVANRSASRGSADE